MGTRTNVCAFFAITSSVLYNNYSTNSASKQWINIKTIYVELICEYSMERFRLNFNWDSLLTLQ